MPRGKHCIRTGFQTVEASALLLVFDQKKDGLAVRGQGSTQPLMPKRSPWTQTLLWCDLSRVGAAHLHPGGARVCVSAYSGQS